jgi:hypothetical protein
VTRKLLLTQLDVPSGGAIGAMPADARAVFKRLQILVYHQCHADRVVPVLALSLSRRCCRFRLPTCMS